MDLNNKIELAKEVFRKRQNFIISDDFNEFIIDCYLNLTPQSYGAQINNEIIKRTGMKKVKSNEDKGDCKINEKYSEIKISYLSTSINWNLIQLRPHQKFEYYIFMLVDNINNYNIIFIVIYKEDVNKFNIRAIHGTKKANENNVNIEYKLVINHNSNEYKQLLELNLLKENSLQGIVDFFNN
jgi:hypothetical protein